MKNMIIIKLAVREVRKICKNDGGFGLNEFLGIAAAVIIAAFVVIPGLRDFAESVIVQLDTWWTSISGNIFQTS